MADGRISDDTRAAHLRCLNAPRNFYQILSCSDMVIGFPYLIKNIEERTTSIGKTTKDKIVLIVQDSEISESSNESELVDKIIFLSDSYKAEDREMALTSLFKDKSRNLFITLRQLKNLPNKTVIPEYEFTSKST